MMLLLLPLLLNSSNHAPPALQLLQVPLGQQRLLHLQVAPTKGFS
jgi:hypothetical protein